MKKNVVIIGGSVLDVFAYPINEMILYDSNPSYLTKHLGGVGRNIAENLARLNIDVTLITVLGEDEAGDMIKNQAKALNYHLIYKSIEQTPTYISIMTHTNQDLIGIAATDQIKLLDVSLIKNHLTIINQADLVVIDTNLLKETLDFIFNNVKPMIYADAISSQKAKKLSPYLALITGLKLNVLEAQTLSGIKEITAENVIEAGHFFNNKGVKEVFITLGHEGAFFQSTKTKEYKKVLPLDIKNTTGAGDAFFSGAIYAKLNDLNMLDVALANAIINLSSDGAVSSLLNETLLIEMIKTYF